MALNRILCLISAPLLFFHVKTLALTSLIITFASLAFGQFEAPGTVKATSKLRPDGSMSTTIVDPDKRTAEETLTDASGKMMKKTVYSLDENNFVTGAVYYDAKGNVRYKERYTLDYSNRITESAIFSATNQPLGRRVFTFDSKGKTHVDDYDAAGNLMVQNGTGSRGKRQTSTSSSTPTVRRALPAR